MKREAGFTLIEVVCALVIAGIFLTGALSLLHEQWKLAHDLKSRLEAQYSLLTAGKAVSTAIRHAQTIEWNKATRELKVLPLPDAVEGQPTQDTYYISDLDYNGIKDLYWKHKGVSQPLASYVNSWDLVEVEPGLWDLFLQVSCSGQSSSWKLSIRQRLHPEGAAPD